MTALKAFEDCHSDTNVAGIRMEDIMKEIIALVEEYQALPPAVQEKVGYVYRDLIVGRKRAVVKKKAPLISRETVLYYIKKNPGSTCNELAEILGSRSSGVYFHVRNLMKCNKIVAQVTSHPNPHIYFAS